VASPASAASSAQAPAGPVTGALTLYTSMPLPNANQLKDLFEKKYPGTQVTIFRSGTEDLMAKLKAEIEGNAVQADLLLVSDAPTFEQLKEQGLLQAYASPEARLMRPELIDRDQMYFGTKMLNTIVAYNTRVIQQPPTSFSDLTKAAYRDKVVIPDPAFSGAASFNAVVFSEAPTLGWDFYRGLAANGTTVVNGNPQALEKLISGEFGVAMVTDFDTRAAKANGSPVDYIWPSEGVPVITEPVGITKASKNPVAARAFVDYLLSKEGQEWAVTLNYLPGRNDVKGPAGVPDLSSIKVLPADAQVIMRKRQAAREQFAQIFGR
jgi:iron(III) transport system substrate-binding protein